MSISTNPAQAVPTEEHGGSKTPRLKRELRWWHILMIGIGGTIGVGFESEGGEILAIAGPGGLLVAFVVMGVVTCMVMEGVCEQIVLWPISNPMIEFVRAFVDRDLAIVVGIAYWYTNIITFVALVIAAGNLLDFWGISTVWKDIMFVIFPVVLGLINSRGVKLYGDIEFVGGVLKVIFLTGIFLLMLVINGGAGAGPHTGNTCINDGIQYNPNVAGSSFTAVLISIRVAAFAYLGTELITVTAFEAVDPNELKQPAKNIAYYIFAIYTLNVLGIALNVEWFNPNLPQDFNQALVDPKTPDLGHTPIKWPADSSGSTAAPVIAILQSGIPNLPGFVTACIVYSALSAANTCLYVSSRTLYGLTRDLEPDSDSGFVRFFARFNSITPKTNVPGWALLVSVLSFFWLPFISLGSQVSQGELQNILITIGSTGCVLVWASQCLAFIRYNRWLQKHRSHLRGNYARFNRWEDQGFQSWFSAIQPLPAYVGLIGCLTTVIILNSASMWNGEGIMIKILTLYFGPFILVLIFVILKFINRRPWVDLGEWRELRQTLNNLDSLIYQASSRPKTDANFSQQQPFSQTPPFLQAPSPSRQLQTFAYPVSTPPLGGVLQRPGSPVTPSPSRSPDGFVPNGPVTGSFTVTHMPQTAAGGRERDRERDVYKDEAEIGHWYPSRD